MQKKVEVTIHPDGSTTVEVSGVKDGSCKTLTKDLLAKLNPGAQPDVKLKPEGRIPVAPTTSTTAKL